MSNDTLFTSNSFMHPRIKPSYSITSIERYNTQVGRRNTRSSNRSPSYSLNQATLPSNPTLLTINQSIDIPNFYPPTTSLETVNKELDNLSRKRKFQQKLSLTNSMTTQNIFYHPKQLHIYTSAKDYSNMINVFGKGKERTIKKELTYLKNSLLPPSTSQKLVYNPPIAFTSFNKYNKFSNNVNTTFNKKNSVLEYIKSYSPCQRKIIRNSSATFNKRTYPKENGDNYMNKVSNTINPNAILIGSQQSEKNILKSNNAYKVKAFKKAMGKPDKNSVETYFNELNQRNKSLKELLGLYKTNY